MLRSMLRSKIHGATVTGKSLEYAGSITVDPALLKAADMLPNEMVQVLNVNNGARFETYVIEGRAGSGDVLLNGPAARQGEPGDRVLIVAYALFDEAEAAKHQPTVIKVDRHNKPVS